VEPKKSRLRLPFQKKKYLEEEEEKVSTPKMR